MSIYRELAGRIFGERFTGSVDLDDFVLVAATESDKGRVRDHNEDSVVYQDPPSPIVRRRRGVLAVLADGMGGHAAGEIASRLACETVSTEYFKASGAVDDALHQAIKDANRRIYRAARKNAAEQGMGTTCVALAIARREAHYAWVGDSRLYLIRGACVYRLTEDHTTVNELVRDGLLAGSEAASHPDKGVLSRALGTREHIEVATAPQPMPVRAEDRFVLCSDGLHDVLSDEDILSLCSNVDETTAARSMVALANEKGAPDNVSVVVVSVAAPNKSEGRTSPTRQTRGV